MYTWIGKITSHPKQLRRAAVFLNWLPERLLFFFCFCLGIVLYRSSSTLRQVIKLNMKEIIIGSSPHQINRYALQYYHNLVITLYEIIIKSWQLEKDQQNVFHSEGEQNLLNALSKGRGAIIFAPHLGNFFYYYWFLSRRYHCLTVGTASSPELKPLYDHFEQMGCRGLDYDLTSPLEMMRSIRQHLASNGVLFILGDFWRPQFPITQLFGKKTRSPQGAATIGIDQQTPIIPFCGYRNRLFEHRLVFEQPIYLNEIFAKNQRAEATLLLNQTLEKNILKSPSQWFYWFNLRERWEKE